MINLDITTKNSVYNTLGAQSQWVQHRFGKRDYPKTEIDLTLINKILHHTDDTVHFTSIFGDPTSHSQFLEVLNATSHGKNVISTNLNFADDRIIEAFNKQQSYLVVPLYGIEDLCDKIVLKSNWEVILDNLKKLECAVCVEFYVFEHNIHQLDHIKSIAKDLNFDLKIKKGVALHPKGFSPIVDYNGNWLYDVYSCNETTQKITWSGLHKTVKGYNSLIHFIKPTTGRNILNNPFIYKVDNKHCYDDNLSISATGHVFPSFEMHQTFSNALCTDWNLSFANIVGYDKITVREDLKHQCAILTNVLKFLEIGNNLYKKDLSDILSDFANSNI